MKVRNFAKWFAVLLTLVIGLAVVSVTLAEDATPGFPVITEEAPVEVVVTEVVTPAATVVEVPTGEINEQIPGYDSAFIQSIINSALDRYGQQSLAFIVVIGIIVVVALVLIYRSLPPESGKKLRADALIGLDKLQAAVDVKREAATLTPRPDDDLLYNLLKAGLERIEARVIALEANPPVSPPL